MLPHAIYYDTLGSIADESSDDWKTMVAGLFVLRLVDDWLDFGPHIVTTDITALTAVHDAIAQIPAGNPVRSLLHQIVNVVEEAETASVSTIAPSVLAYVRALQYDGRYDLARDVLSSMRSYAVRSDNADAMVQISLSLAYVLRMSGSMEDAYDNYLAASKYASIVGDKETALRAHIGVAKIATMRGNFDEADSICVGLGEAAVKANFPRLVGDIFRERAHIANTAGNYQASVRFAYQALEHITTEAVRDQVMADLSSAFISLGHFSAARDTNAILSMCAQDQITRWQAMINMMYAAAMEHQEDAFDLYRVTLELAPLDPWSEIYFRKAAAEGYRMFGHADLAQYQARAAYAIAEEHGMKHLIAELDQVLTKQPTGSWSSDIDVIAEAIGEQLRFIKA